MPILVSFVFLLGTIAATHFFVMRKPSLQPPYRKRRLRYFVYAGVGAIALSALAFDAFDIITHSYPEWQMTVFLGSVIIALGWIVTNEISLNNSRKQHTINLVTSIVNNDRRIKDKEVINKILPPYGAVITPVVANYDDATNELIQAIDRELNFYEFIAVGLETGDLDEEISRRFLEVSVPAFVSQVNDYIEHWRRKDPRIWENVCDLADKWKSR